MEEILIPISVCVVLPVMVVWLVNRTRQNEINRKADIMLKAIESGAGTILPDSHQWISTLTKYRQSSQMQCLRTTGTS